MLPILCNVCGNPIANKEIYYLNEIKKLYLKYNINDETIFENKSIENDFINDRKKIIDYLFKNICCRIKILTYIDHISLIN